MQKSEIIADRFELGDCAGAGGMGQVFRGRDLHNNQTVAIKMLLAGPNADSYRERFAREARVLAELSDSRIVRYVAHGFTSVGHLYLVMEWLDGEDLGARLRRGPLTVEQSVKLVRGLAEGLGAAHEHGVVHRDLKPSNIFLLDGRIDSVKLLDFGIARLKSATELTQTGAVMGTPGYMAPEQIQGDHPVDARADIFSLGCVLFECLTGQTPFFAETPMARFAKVLFGELPRPRQLRPELPERLERLLLQMLAKDPGARPADGAAVAREFSDLELRAPGEPVAPALTRAERRMTSVILIAVQAGFDEASLAQTLDQAEAEAASVLRRCADAWGARLWPLRGGAKPLSSRTETPSPLREEVIVVSIEGVGLATDQATRAARCALALHPHAGGRPIALASGSGDTGSPTITDEALARAMQLLGSRPDSGIAIDEMTAHLLDGRFDVREEDHGLVLHSERELTAGLRPLLKRLTPCVGRDRELSTLAQIFSDCVDEPQAQAVLVTGAAGMGKSRLTQEFLARLRQGGAKVAVWLGRGDSLRAGSPFGHLGQALRGACGIRGTESLPECRTKLLSHVAHRVAASERQRVAELLGELIGVPFPDEDSALLRAARHNAQIMSDELRRAWLDFLRAETAAEPLIIVLEDLHWSDGATVRFIDAALREVSDRPWMVLALARPEVHELFPKLWAERHLQEFALRPLARKASMRLVEQVLGSEASPDTAERIIAQADGNAFYLEELIRALAEHRSEALPETVLAMVQSRLAALDDHDRRVLRAAAVFGETVWPGGVAALLGGDSQRAYVQQRLLGLVEREVLLRRQESRFANEAEFAFRHVLLREGAYKMLTADDCRVGHALAGEWRERAGERDAKLLAAHFEHGGAGERAAAYYLRAAEQAADGSEPEAALHFAERGLSLSPTTETLTALLIVKAEMTMRLGDIPTSFAAASTALEKARPGSDSEARALAIALLDACFMRDLQIFQTLDARLLHTEPRAEVASGFAAALFSAITALIIAGQPERARAYLRKLEQMTTSTAGAAPLVEAWTEMSRAMVVSQIDGDFYAMANHARAAIEKHRQWDNQRPFDLGYHLLSIGLGFAGAFEEAESVIAGFTATSGAVVQQLLHAQNLRAHLCLDQGKFAEAKVLARWAVERSEVSGDPYIYLTSRLSHLEALLRLGELSEAEAEALAVEPRIDSEPYVGIWYFALLAMLRLLQARPSEACEQAERAYRMSRACMKYAPRSATILLVRAEALEAIGDRARACDAVREARDDLLQRAARIPDLSKRRRFLENLPDHRRTLDLARQWLGEAV